MTQGNAPETLGNRSSVLWSAIPIRLSEAIKFDPWGQGILVSQTRMSPDATLGENMANLQQPISSRAPTHNFAYQPLVKDWIVDHNFRYSTGRLDDTNLMFLSGMCEGIAQQPLEDVESLVHGDPFEPQTTKATSRVAVCH